MIIHSLVDSLLGAVLITGLVTIMMMMIECLNIGSRGAMMTRLSRSHFGQVFLAALLGAVPGCMGGFAVVSLYSHSLLSFGALVAMMIATMGDESFVMLAMFPHKTLVISLCLFALAVIAGLAVDAAAKRMGKPITRGEAGANCLAVHSEDCCDDPCHCKQQDHHHGGRHLSLRRALMFVGVGVFIAALALGKLEHGHEEAAHPSVPVPALNLLSEDWMNLLFSLLSIAVLAVIARSSDHFVEDHLWGHIIAKHLPRVFLWTSGVLVALNIGMQFVDISGWVSDNVVLTVIVAALIGIIPESGPHLVFVTLFASGVIPLPVLVASCISQDGHAGLPLLAESPRTFFFAKALNVILAIAAGLLTMAFLPA